MRTVAPASTPRAAGWDTAHDGLHANSRTSVHTTSSVAPTVTSSVSAEPGRHATPRTGCAVGAVATASGCWMHHTAAIGSEPPEKHARCRPVGEKDSVVTVPVMWSEPTMSPAASVHSRTQPAASPDASSPAAAEMAKHVTGAAWPDRCRCCRVASSSIITAVWMGYASTPTVGSHAMLSWPSSNPV